jgi:hypothetical protein
MYVYTYSDISMDSVGWNLTKNVRKWENDNGPLPMPTPSI